MAKPRERAIVSAQVSTRTRELLEQRAQASYRSLSSELRRLIERELERDRDRGAAA